MGEKHTVCEGKWGERNRGLLYHNRRREIQKKVSLRWVCVFEIPWLSHEPLPTQGMSGQGMRTQAAGTQTCNTFTRLNLWFMSRSQLRATVTSIQHKEALKTPTYLLLITNLLKNKWMQVGCTSNDWGWSWHAATAVAYAMYQESVTRQPGETKSRGSGCVTGMY